MKRNSITLLVTILLLAACNPEKRITRLIQKYPNLADTVVTQVQDTITIAQIKDSVAFKDSVVLDTHIVFKDSARIHLVKRNGKVKVKYQTVEKQVPYVQTITKTVNIAPEVKQKLEEQRNSWRRTTWILAGIILAAIVIIVFVKMKK